jgi:hypothetical protein
MRKVTRLVITALFLQFFIGGVGAEAASSSLRISGVSVNGTIATVKWNSAKLTSKDFFEVEFSKTSTAKTYKVIKTKSSAIVAKLDPFTQYTVRIRKTLTPKTWTSLRTFKTLSDPVTGLVASNIGYVSADLSWNPVAGANAYDILVNDVLLVSVVTTKYTLTDLKPGSKNLVVVRAKSGLTLGSSSPATTVVPLNLAPAKLLASGITTTGSILTWESIPGAEGYNIYANKVLLARSKTTTYTVSGLLPGTVVTYSVSAVFGKSETPVSDSVEVTTLMDIPVAPTISSVTSSSFLVSWVIDRNATSYEVTLYDATGKVEVLNKTVDGTLTSTTFSGLTTQTSYTVGIKNVYLKTTSKQSALATTITSKPIITGVVMSNVTTVSATLNWYPMPGVVTYEVYRDGVIIPQATSALTTASVSYNFVGLSPGATYKFSVRASYYDGTKTLLYTDFVDSTQTLVTDPTFAPVSTAVPVITLPFASVPIVGATLSASTGQWSSIPTITGYTYQWQRSLDSGSTWTDLVGETKSTYKVTASDYAFRLRVKVTAKNINGIRTAESATSSAVAETYNVQIPVVRGTLVIGQLLEVTDGTWSSDYPLTFRYQWKRNGSEIPTAISPSYTLTDDDINKQISVSVIAYSSLGSVNAESTVRSAVAAAGNSVAPVITGAVKVYSTLTTSSGTWLNSPSLSYQWQRSLDGTLWNNIASADSSTYVISLSDVGYFIRSQVFGSKTVSTAYKYTASSLPTIVVPALTVISTGAPVITGSWTEGSTLSTSNGTWTSSGTFTYQWQNCSSRTDLSTCANISGATSRTYLLKAGDAFIRVQVYLTSSSGDAGVAYSVLTQKIGAPYNTLAPAISGTLRVGLAQTTTTGTWTGSPTFTYQWQTSSDGIAWANIDSATTNSYTPTYSVANLKLRVVVTGTNSTDTATATSQVVQAFLAPIATVLPVISGTVASGSTLTTDSGTWPGAPNAFTYSWHRSSDGGNTWTDIAGQTGTTYVLVSADVGYAIRSQVTVTTNAGSSTAYSLPTVPVAP